MVGAKFLRNLVERRTLLWQLVRRDFEQRFIGSAVGWIWGLVHPLVLVASWTFVFQYCMRVPMPPNEATGNYTLFLICGYLPWMLFSETVMRSASSLVEHSNLITKTVFPTEIIPISIFLSSLLNHLLALAITVAVVGLSVNQVSPMIVLLPVYMVFLGLLAVGVGWIVSSLQVYLRDTAQALSVIMTFWFWMTPIFISLDQVPPHLRFLITGNPLSFLVRAYRDRMLSYRLPDWSEMAALAGYSVAAFVVGGLVFRQLKRGFADVL